MSRWLVGILSILLLTACAPDPQAEAARLQRIAMQTLQPLYVTATFEARIVQLTQAAEAGRARATQDAARLAMEQAEADRAYIEAAMQVTRMSASATANAQATQSVQASQAALEAARSTQQAAQATASAARETASAQSTATERAWQAAAVQASAAAQAQATATERAWMIYSGERTSTAQAQATQDAYQANILEMRQKELQLAVENRERYNALTGLAPYVVLTVILALITWMIYIYWRAEAGQRSVIRDSAGDPRWLNVPQIGGQLTVINPELMLEPGLEINRSGQVSQPELVPLAIMAQVQQRLTLLNSLRTLAQHGQANSEARQALVLEAGPRPAEQRPWAVVEALPNSVADSETVKIIDAEWRQEVDRE
jgi:chemotaxis protein histidine kinase CheA